MRPLVALLCIGAVRFNPERSDWSWRCGAAIVCYRRCLQLAVTCRVCVCTGARQQLAGRQAAGQTSVASEPGWLAGSLSLAERQSLHSAARGGRP